MTGVSHQISWGERAFFYTFAEAWIEVLFTGIKDYKYGHFEGYTQLWVFPTAAIGGLAFEPVHSYLVRKNVPTIVRTFLYAMGIFAVEYSLGVVNTWYTKLPRCTWHYESDYSIDGYIQPLYTPFWMFFGWLAEKAHNRFLELNSHLKKTETMSTILPIYSGKTKTN